MLGKLFSSAVARPQVIFVIRYLMSVYAVIVGCIAITMLAALRMRDPGTWEIAYRMFRDLLSLARPWRRG